LQETDSDDGPTHENSYKFNNNDKEHIFDQIKQELENQDIPDKPIESNYWQTLRKKEFYDGYQDYLDLANAQGSPRRDQLENLSFEASPDFQEQQRQHQPENESPEASPVRSNSY
jgi:hypothetical protein